MRHLTAHGTYRNLRDRINWFTQGVPASGTLYKILQVLYSEEEAKWVAPLPVHPLTIKRATKIWGTSEHKAGKLLGHPCGKALLVNSWDKGMQKFVMLPPVVGFAEFALMRTRGDIDRKYFSELYHQYMNVEKGSIKDLFCVTETKLGRTFVQESILTNDRMSRILGYKRAAHIVEKAEYIGLGLCYCHHKMFRAGHPCEISALWDACLTFDNMARSLVQYGDRYRLISKEEAMDALEHSYVNNLVRVGENMWEYLAFIYNCCGHYYETLQTARRFSPMQPVATMSYIPDISGDRCVGCGKCVKVCPVLAISTKDRGNGKKHAVMDKDICLGCDVCTRNCGVKATHMERRPEWIITPVNSAHRLVLQAIEKGTLASLTFDNQVFSNHRVMAALLSATLELPPLKQTIASKQFKFVYLDRLLAAKREEGWTGEPV